MEEKSKKGKMNYRVWFEMQSLDNRKLKQNRGTQIEKLWNKVIRETKF